MTLLAFHNKKEIKEEYLSRVIAHRKADEIVKGKYWENGKGCAVGCTIHSGKHENYETELGIPRIIAQLEDRLFENIPMDLAKTWPERFLKAIKPGADLSLVWDKFASRLLTDPIGGVIQYAKTEEQLEVIQRVSDLYEAKIAGLTVDIQDWRAATAAAAAAAAADATAYATAYADATADATAYAYASTAAADATAYAYAADATAYAYAAAAADARTRAYIWQSELLLGLLKDAE